MEDQERIHFAIENLVNTATDAIKNQLSKNITKEDVCSFLEEVNKEETLKDYSYIKQLLSIAEEDLKSAEILHNKQIYSQSTYHLQQCIEKITKAYALFTGHITLEELKYHKKKKPSFINKLKFWKKSDEDFSVGHISPKAFLILLNKKNFKKKIQLILKISSDHETVEATNKQIEKIIHRKKELEICNLSKTQIKTVISIYNNLGKSINRNKNVLKHKIKTFLITMKNIVAKNDQFKEDEKNRCYVELTRFNKIKDFYLDSPINTLFLFMLSIITFPHFNYTRYPGNNQFGIKNYSLNLGIVNIQPELFKIIDRRLIKRFNQIVDRSIKQTSKKEESQ